MIFRELNRFAVLFFLLLVFASVLRAGTLEPDPDWPGQGKFPEHLNMVYSDAKDETGAHVSGILFGIRFVGGPDSNVTEVFAVNTRSDFDADVVLDTRYGVLRGSCSRMTYSSIGTVKRNLNGAASMDAVVTEAKLTSRNRGGPRLSPSQRPIGLPSRMPEEVAAELSPEEREQKASAWRKMKKLALDESGDFAVGKVVTYVFGGEASLVLDAMKRVPTADPIADEGYRAKVRDWQNRCQTYIKDYDTKAAAVKTSQNLARSLQISYKQTSSEYEQRRIMQQLMGLDGFAKQELNKLGPRIPARAWCGAFMNETNRFLKPKPRPQSDAQDVVIP